MSADFAPIFDNKAVQPFRYWTHKILPLVYDDSLSYYELIAKVYEKLNEAINAVDTNIEDMHSMLIAYKQLEDYVNQYTDPEEVERIVSAEVTKLVLQGAIRVDLTEYLKKVDVGAIPNETIDVIVR